MAEKVIRKYPVGVQSFKLLRKEGYVYVDKTPYISRLLDGGTRYAFLSRPRRFGKSLLVSTLHELFAGNRDLFRGLYIDQTDWQWTKHPVLHFDLSQVKSTDPADVEEAISDQLDIYEHQYGRSEKGKRPNTRLAGLIRRACEKEGQPVVLLIDEYDAPMMEVLADGETFHKMRQVMRNFYSPIKACDPFLRFTFLTGITKFSQMSIFSELNNLRNISMLPDFAGICGITKEELDTALAPDVELLAERRGESREEVRDQLRQQYDGYHFTWPSDDVFNPFSLLNAFNDKAFKNYWFATATPAFLIEMLRKNPDGMLNISGRWTKGSRFDVAAERPSDLLPLLYQTGYLTIKAYDPEEEQYLLEMPNNEVRNGVTDSLIEGYVGDGDAADRNISAMRRALRADDLDGALRALKKYLAAKPYLDQAQQSEAYYQDLLFVIFTMLGCRIDMEVRAAAGRIDMVLYRPGRIYLMELKVNSTPRKALAQIDERAYAARFSGRQEQLVKVGINFSTRTRTLTGWSVATAQ